ncbi:acetyl-CoA C-acyltransferase [Halotalea alkalilenta]|uniref:acetyl-CoA C-acyltransferase n=1 Tax=Halotalea alkalilenta TaxID=376489 RepID=A0A172YIT6_9GAMM|nr:acetyl-CoA C-acyltransferase [Halotalea alkalilenta]ANF59128.1 acetyl-CoA acetyltransferase [Halotalea alkalilenta]
MTTSIQDVYVVAACRSPITKAPRGAFRHVRPDDLLAHCLRGALAQAPKLDPARIDDTVIGCAMPEGSQGMNVARISALLAGLPQSVAGQTVNRFCASGLQAIATAAARIRLGEAQLMLAGGVESMSQVPMMGYRPAFNPRLFEDGMQGDEVGIAFGMGLTAERVARRWQVPREAQDAFALASHHKALAAQASGELMRSALPFEVTERHPDPATGAVALRQRLIDADEGPRADTSLEALAKLRPAFSRDGTVTAGNSSQTSDGAAALLLASTQAVREFDLIPLARFRGFAVAGVAPEVMGIGPVAAVPKALDQAGIALDRLDWIELNEAFAAQALAVIQELALDPGKVNPLGGAIALGHPLGATGAIRTAMLLHGLRERGQKYGMVTMCIGTGMGAAGIFEAL